MRTVLGVISGILVALLALFVCFVVEIQGLGDFLERLNSGE
jgi:hypothetical protein